MAESRERVLESAAQLFLGSGFHKVGIAEICEQARVNKGTFYHFFHSKLDLLIEVVDHYVDECGRDFRKIAQSHDEAEQKVRNIFSVPRERNMAWKEAHGSASGCFVGNVILEMAASEPGVRPHLERCMASLIDELRPIAVEFLKEHGDAVDDGQAQRAADLLMTLLQGAQVQAKVRNDPFAFDAYAEMAPAMLVSCAAQAKPRA